MSEKNNKNGDRVSQAMSGLSEKFIDEAAACTPEKGKKLRFRRTLAAVLAAVVLLSAIPIGGILIANRTKPDTPAVPIDFSGGSYSAKDGSLPPELEEVRISAEGGPGRTVPVDGSFIIETSGETDAETVAEYLSISPAISASVTQLDAKTFKIQPANGSLAPGNVYRLTLGDPENPAVSYAFQTETELAVKSVFPADLATGVPVDTGIEIAFTEAVVLEGKPVAVSPEVKGSFSLYPDGRTILFLPDSKLDYDTVYTITVASGVTGQSGRKLENGVTAKFRTVSKENEKILSGVGGSALLLSLYNSESVFSPGENAFVSFYISRHNIENTPSVSCELYAFASASDAASALIESEKSASDGKNAAFDLSKLKKIGSFKPDGVSSYREQISFGTALPSGTYLAVIKATATDDFGKRKETEISVPVQITPLRAYTVSSDGTSLFWLNRDGSGVVQNALVTATLLSRYDGWESDNDGKKLSLRTDAGGLASFENGGKNAAVILAEAGDDSLIVCANLAGTDGYDYMMKYIYTDREVYFPNDTVNFFGFISPSFGGELPDVLYLETGLSRIKTAIKVNENGLFTGSFTYSDVGAGYFTLILTDAQGRQVAARSFRVTEESKPQYTASVSFDRLFYRRGDTVKVTLTASFFDGTPVEGLEFNCRLGYFSDGAETVKTDKNGRAVLTYKTRALKTDKVSGTYPVYLYFSAELVGFETQRLTVSSETVYFNSDYSAGVSRSDDGVKMTLNRRDFSKLQTEADLSWQVFPGNTVGEPVNKSGALSYTLYKYVITKTPRIEYDQYTKRQRTVYSYKTTESVVKSGKADFVNGEAVFDLYEAEGFEGYFRYVFRFSDDSTGCVYEYEADATKRTGKRYSYSDSSDIYEKISLNAGSFSVGDRVRASLTLADPGTKSLFVIAANGIVSFKYAESVEFEYTDDMIAGGKILAVSFDAGSADFWSELKTLSYKVGQATLTPVIEPSAAEFRPGDRATVTVRVPGASGGFAVVSIVDEACFALGDQTADPSAFFKSSSALYSRISGYYRIDNYYRINPSAPELAINGRFLSAAVYSDSDLRNIYYKYDRAEATEEAALSDGENSADYVRKVFSDNPEFSVIELDAEGKGVLVFTVPDNITSWRITALAVSGAGGPNGGIKTGSAVSDVVCTLPFFINLGVCEKYVLGDTVSISARSYGSRADGKVKYTAVFADELGNAVSTVTGSADSKERCWLKFNPDRAGRYSVTVYGECGDSRDALTSRFDVVVSAVAADVNRSVTAEELKSLSPVYYPVRIVFSNRTPSYGLYERVVSALSYNRHSGRSDEYVALYASAAAAEKLYGADNAELREDIIALLSQYNFRSGAFTLFPYSETDTLLTAEIISLGLPVSENLIGIAVNVNRSLASQNSQLSPEELAACLAVLAAAGEPVLDTLYSTASIAGGWSDEAKLILAFAFASCGDYPAARDIYAQVREAIAHEDAEFGTLRFGTSGSADEKIRLTSLALLSASRIDRQDAAKLALWLLENRSDAESAQIALASYLKFFLPAEKVETAEFTFTVSGQAEKVVLESGRSYAISLSKEELASLELDIPGTVSIGVSYKGTAEEALAGRDESQRVTIEKKLEPQDNGTCVVYLTVSGTSTRVYESFSIYDLIPSGARFLGLTSSGYRSSWARGENCDGYIYNRSGQNMSGWISVLNRTYCDGRRVECPEYRFSVTVSYTIRGAVDGDFIVESAFIRGLTSDVFSVSKRQKVTIVEKGLWSMEKD